MRIHYYSHAGRGTGYGRAARGYLMGLASIDGVAVTDAPLENALEPAPPCDVIVHHGTPAQLAAIGGNFRKGPAVAVTTWETSILPGDSVHALAKYYQAVVVPSRFCARVIGDSIHAVGTKQSPVRVKIVPHAFDPAEWLQADRPKRDDGVFNFYSIGDWSERKNMLGVIRAYLAAFSKDDKTRLVVISEGADFNVIRSVIGRSGLKPEDLPGLLVPDRRLSDTEIYRLHLESDCYLSAARCEGFGLGMFEAMIMGRPVIAPGYGGQEDFLEDYPGWYKISHQLTPVFAGEGELSVSSGQVHGTIKLPRGANARQLWAEPNLGQMIRLMQDIREGRALDLDGDRAEIEDRYSTTVIGQQLYDVLKGVIS